ncbi:MAG: hypothetical protein JNN15_11755 [Blastocatellia bacterium]|nr:hypothetical protein [Blastocatellia bacterium]
MNALDWYTNEVIPFATDIDTKLYIDAMKAINSSFRINPSISRHMKLVAREFCNRMQALLTASMKHSELAERVVANVDIAMTGFRPLFAEDRLLAVVLEETDVTFTNEPDISQFLLSYAKNAFQYASRNSRTLKDFAIADKIEIETSFSDGSEFVSANIGFICSTIAKSMVSFEWNGLLPSSLTENWNSLIKICPASGICLERLLIGFVYSTSNIKAVASRLRILDYLQALIEFTRQCSAGIELGNNVLRLASKVAEQIDLTGAAELRQGVSSPSREKCSRDLSYILNALAEGLSSMARPVALLHINRYLIEQVSPFVGYEEAVWRITWRTVATVAEEILAPASCRELKRMCKELENIGKTMPFIGSIARTYTYEQHVQFSEDIHQESDWRQLLCSLLALIQTKESCPDYLSSLRMVLAESILLTEREDFTAELNLLLNQMRDLFIDLDLRQIQSEVEAFRSTVSNIDLLFKLCHTVDEIRRRLVERLPVFGSLASSQRELNFFLLSLAKLSLSQRSHSSTRWTLPQIMTLSSSKVTDTLSNISNSDFERLQAALINSLASYLPSTENLAEQLQNLRRLVLNEKELNTVWIEEWQIEGKEFDETCRRDLQWMARRICFDGWKGDLAASGAIGWYSNEVVPYAGTIQPKIYAKAIRAVTERIQASSRVSQEMKQASSNFRSKMEAALSKQRGYETAEQLLLGDLAASSKEERVEKKSWWSKLTDSIAGRS